MKNNEHDFDQPIASLALGQAEFSLKHGGAKTASKEALKDIMEKTKITPELIRGVLAGNKTLDYDQKSVLKLYIADKQLPYSDTDREEMVRKMASLPDDIFVGKAVGIFNDAMRQAGIAPTAMPFSLAGTAVVANGEPEMGGILKGAGSYKSAPRTWLTPFRKRQVNPKKDLM